MIRVTENMVVKQDEIKMINYEDGKLKIHFLDGSSYVVNKISKSDAKKLLTNWTKK